MPSDAVKKRFADRCRAGKFTPVELSALARTFEVPLQAMARRLEELRLLPGGSYEKLTSPPASSRYDRDPLGESPPQPQALAPQNGAQLAARPSPRPHLPERYITLAVAAYDQEHLSEGEFADYLGMDVVSARAVYQQRSRISLDDGTHLTVDFAANDLRNA